MDFKTLPYNSLRGGHQYMFKADNNYGASIIQHNFSYGNKEGLQELAVIKYDEDDNWHIVYDTPITNDVLGYLTEEDVNETLIKIADL